MKKIHHFFNTEISDSLRILSDSMFEKKGIQFFVKRDDLLHPEVSGNKWRKLKYNLIEAKKQNNRTLLTLGGAFSNHIAAVAAAGALFDFETIGIIRGEKIQPLNPTLAFAERCGMKLRYIDRAQYRKRNQPEFVENLKKEYGDFYFLPEGGTNNLAMKGTAEIIDELARDLPQPPDFICIPVGTGGTAGGVISQAAIKFPKTKIVCFPALKGDFIKNEIEFLLQRKENNWHLQTDYHFGGYAKWNNNLIGFINSFKTNFNIPLEPLYTGKMFFGIFDLTKKDFFPEGSTIVAVHTGGLQGIKGFNQRFGDIISTD